MIHIELSKNGWKNKGKYKTIIDHCDSDLIKINWTVAIKKRNSRTQYAHTTIYKNRVKRVYLHQIIAERHLGKRPSKMLTDHINRNGLDNRRSNLRYVSISENSINSGLSSRNKTGIKGVTKAKHAWKSCLWLNNKEIFLGYFKEKQDAINARRAAETKYIRGKR